jgi:hypothetical protein
VCREHTCCNHIKYLDFQRTEKAITCLRELFIIIRYCFRQNDTSLIPSISTGVLRFVPNVSKLNPDSVLVAHAMTALPPSRPTATVFQTISRMQMRRDTFPIRSADKACSTTIRSSVWMFLSSKARILMLSALPTGAQVPWPCRGRCRLAAHS